MEILRELSKNDKIRNNTHIKINNLIKDSRKVNIMSLVLYDFIWTTLHFLSNLEKFNMTNLVLMVNNNASTNYNVMNIYKKKKKKNN